MTRGRPSHVERDLHALFTAWLQTGAAGDPPRDAAVHAAHCVRCRAATMALDHLSAIDVGRAPIPPSRGLAPERTGPLARPRLVAAAASGFVVVAAAWIGFGAVAPNLLGPGGAGPSTDQEVLGGFGAGGSASATASAAVSFGGVTIASDGATADPSSTTAQPTPAASATQATVATPPPTAVQPPSSPPSSTQTTAPTARPSQPASATASPTPPPTPTPTPAPECSDGIDNDGDTLIDFGLDPGCLSPDDDSEGDLP